MSWSECLGREPDESVERLLDTLSACHQEAARSNSNASSAAIRHVAACGGSFDTAVASALLTLGFKHAPIAAARRLIYDETEEWVVERLEGGEKIPGWGNSFFKKGIDPAFAPIDLYLRSYHPAGASDRLDRISEAIFKVTGKTLFPNAAAYSAVCAEIVNLPRGTESSLFISCRLPVWAEQYAEAQP